ncbi:PP2C domain-containing protein, partial [Cephalotus follicularis]
EPTSMETKTRKGKKQKLANVSEADSESLSDSTSDHSSMEEGTSRVGTPGAGGREEEEGDGARSLKCVLSHGLISVIGRRRVMEDALTVVTGEITDGYDFFGVYDGHGGSSVANACKDRMHQLVAKEVEGMTVGDRGVVDWEKVMAVCFEKMDEEVMSGGVGGAGRMITVGSTALVVIVGKEELVVANCGDSRVVLCRDGLALPLSHDHKPDRPDERERVEAAGGKIIDWNGYRVLGVLATSRSIGDHYLKPYVISEPEVTVSDRTDSDDFLVIASDGLWDVVSNEVACEVVKRCFAGAIRGFSQDTSRSSAGSAAILAELAMARGSEDNISVIVVKLKKPISSS